MISNIHLSLQNIIVSLITFGLLIAAGFFPQVLFLLLGSALYAYFSKQTPLLKIIIGLVLVSLALGFLVFVPLMIHLLFFQNYLKTPLAPPNINPTLADLHTTTVYIVAGACVMYFYWKLRKKHLVVALTIFLVSLALFLLYHPH